MPITVSAAKALRRDRRRTKVNRRYRTKLKLTLDRNKAEASPENLNAAYQILDQAAKNHIIHKNKAARLKSRLAKNLTHPKLEKSKTATRSKKRPPKRSTKPAKTKK